MTEIIAYLLGFIMGGVTLIAWALWYQRNKKP